MTLLRDIVMSDRIKFDPSRNDFPVTMHDPCNLVRLMGVVEPQREIIRKICPQFREMHPHGVNNYCCGGGSGFAIHSGHNFEDWRFKISGRMKLKQILDAFNRYIHTLDGSKAVHDTTVEKQLLVAVDAEDDRAPFLGAADGGPESGVAASQAVRDF